MVFLNPDITLVHLLRGYFEASGKVLDAAIRGFKDYLASDSAPTNADAASSRDMAERILLKIEPDISSSCCLMIMSVASDVPVMKMNNRTNDTECAELIVKEMSAASDLIDTKNRAFMILELFDKSAAHCNTPDEKQKMREWITTIRHQLIHDTAKSNVTPGMLFWKYQCAHLSSTRSGAQDTEADAGRPASPERRPEEGLSYPAQPAQGLPGHGARTVPVQGDRRQVRNYVLSLHLAGSDHQSEISGHRNPDVP
uniref:Uncharacterized protein n=1 Tax=Aegilops tauschii TaxID=37682 RepID=M8BQ01_AEGTA